MSRRGRPPKPLELKVLEGGLSGKELGSLPPKPPPSKPRCPAWLAPYAKTEWRRIVPELDALGMLTQVDRTTLAVYCQQVAIFKEATNIVTRGILTTGQKGEPVKNPALQVLRDSARLIATYSSMFGLSPSDRARILSAGADVPGGPTLEELMAAR